MIELSVVVPLYKCSESVLELASRLTATLETLDHNFQVILVNDGSPDEDWQRVLEVTAADARFMGVNLSRNFGQMPAITAGLHYTSGTWVVVMHGDLQDEPECIPLLYRRALEGYDAVFGRRHDRKDSFAKRFSSRLFWRVFDYLAGTETDASTGNFGVYSRHLINNYLGFKDHYRIFPLLIKWQGFNIGYVDIDHAERPYGKTAYTYRQLINGGMDVIVSHSNRPLKLSIKFGFLLATFSFTYLSWLVVRKLFLDVPMGWTSIMVSIFFIGGLLFANLGLIGLYIGKIYDEVKNRPIFLVKDVTGQSQLFSTPQAAQAPEIVTPQCPHEEPGKAAANQRNRW